MLTTAGRLLFAGDGAGNLVAFDPANGKPLWHSRIGNVTNAPQTYMLDGKQYLLAAAGDALFAFALYIEGTKGTEETDLRNGATESTEINGKGLSWGARSALRPPHDRPLR